VADAAMRIATNEIDSESLEKALAAMKTDALKTKQLYTALLNLAYEAARHDAKLQEISSLVDDRLSSDRLEVFVGLFEAHKAKIRSQLARSGMSFPNIVDIDWRLDYYIQNNQLEQIRTPVYFITLTTQKADTTRSTVEFTASLEQLQDLLAHVKNACNAAKLVNI
jgi:polycomb group RING finger protein 4